MLVSVFNVLLWRWSNSSDIVVGIPISGRYHRDLEKLIGMFVNVIMLRTRITDDASFSDLLDEVNKEFLQSCSNAEIPYSELVEHLGEGEQSLFNVSFVMQNTGGTQKITLDKDVLLEPYSYDNTMSRNDDLLLEAIDDGELKFILEYRADYFSESSIRILMDQYNRMLEQFLLNPMLKLNEIDLLNNEEKQLVLNEFNDSLEEVIN
ncbi:Tyrocidine synthase 3 [compost metagenome]